jgi:hypothetical protein
MYADNPFADRPEPLHPSPWRGPSALVSKLMGYRERSQPLGTPIPNSQGTITYSDDQRHPGFCSRKEVQIATAEPCWVH